MNEKKNSGLANIINSIAHQLNLSKYASASIELPEAQHYFLCLIDGLSDNLFLENEPNLSFLKNSDEHKTVVSGFPSTTAVSLTSLATGLDSIEHGMVGSAFCHNQQYFSPLRWGYLSKQDSSLQQVETDILIPKGTWGEMHKEGIQINAFLPLAIANSEYTKNVFSNAKIHSYEDSTLLINKISQIVKTTNKTFSYIYFGNLDYIGHIQGAGSKEWKDELFSLESIIKNISRVIPKKSVLMVTSDHGMINIENKNMTDFSQMTDLKKETYLICGDIRARHIYLKSEHKEEINLAKWNNYLGENFNIYSRKMAIDNQMFGTHINPNFSHRLGDLIIVSKNKYGLVDTSSLYDQYQTSWIGHHGAISDDEQRIPLLIWG